MLPYRATRRSADNSRFSLCNDAYGFRDVGLRRARPIGVLTASLPISGMRSEMAITVRNGDMAPGQHRNFTKLQPTRVSTDSTS
jgi:hypothetical protein